MPVLQSKIAVPEAASGLSIWAGLDVESIVLVSRQAVHEARGLLRILDSDPCSDSDLVTVAPARSWILPPINPHFAFPESVWFQLSGSIASSLWTETTCGAAPQWDEDAWQKLLSERGERNWWLLARPDYSTILAERVKVLAPLRSVASRLIVERHPFCRIRSLVVTGSYLWSSQPRGAVDLIAIVDDPECETLMTHYPAQHLSPDEQWPAGGTRISSLDILVISAAVLTGASSPTGVIANWTLPNGRQYPYDLRTETVTRAVAQTIAAGIPVLGQRAVSAPEPRSLLALAYYFAQEASFLLAWRVNPRKGINRLWESLLILACYGRMLGLDVSGWLAGAKRAEHLATAWRATPSPDVLAEVAAPCPGPGGLPPLIAVVVEALAEARAAIESVARSSIRQKGEEPAGDPLTDLASIEHWAVFDPRELRRARNAMAEITATAMIAERERWPSWELLEAELSRYPALGSVQRVDHALRSTVPGTLARTARPGRQRERATEQIEPGTLHRLVLWACIGPGILRSRSRTVWPTTEHVIAFDAMNYMCAAAQDLLAADPALSLGDPWTWRRTGRSVPST